MKLPTEDEKNEVAPDFGAAKGTRTLNLLFTRQLLYH